jgi:hypothetical protein
MADYNESAGLAACRADGYGGHSALRNHYKKQFTISCTRAGDQVEAWLMAGHPLQKWEPTFQILDGGGSDGTRSGLSDPEVMRPPLSR